MRLYADTSWWLAYKCRADSHHAAAITLFDRLSEAEVLWTPWQRVEVFNGFRQVERAGLLATGDSNKAIRLLEKEVQLGYWTHAEFSWTDAVRTACKISETHSLHRTVRAMDLFHVAVAVEIATDAFVSFDEEQLMLAKAAGFRTVRLKRDPLGA